MKKTLIVGGFVSGVLALGGTVAVLTQNDEKITLEDPQAIEWVKPKTDAEWAEDVKKENFDIKTNEELKEMIVTHSDDLKRMEKELTKYQSCAGCAYWEVRALIEQSYPNLTEKEVDEESQKASQDQYGNVLFEVEKLKQSIERMNKELELRDKGYVELQDDKRKEN